MTSTSDSCLRSRTGWPRRSIPGIAQVDPRYIVKIDEHIYVHELSVEQRQFLGRADVAVAQGSPAVKPAAATTALAAPVEGYLPAVDVERLSFVEIRDRRNRQLVTLIELLSPSNKRPGGDRDQYLAKRNEILASAVHFVEIDLLRGGRRMPVENLPPCRGREDHENSKARKITRRGIKRRPPQVAAPRTLSLLGGCSRETAGAKTP